MTLALALALVLGAAGTTSVVMSVAKPLHARCPACSKKRLVHVPASGRDSLYARYRCGGCTAQWVACGGGLVAREAFAAGARDPFPRALLRR
jgi:hypothetical protein